jgi:hypothetical protein
MSSWLYRMSAYLLSDIVMLRIGSGLAQSKVSASNFIKIFITVCRIHEKAHLWVCVN